VFVHRNDVAEEVASKLTHHKLAVADLNSELSKLDRKQAFVTAKSRQIRLGVDDFVTASDAIVNAGRAKCHQW
jgi:hypothetical protein